jgi:hypothetical protein
MRATAKEPPARLLRRLVDEGSLEVGQDGALRARRDEGGTHSLDVHVGALPVPPVRPVDRDHREDAIRAHEGAVAQRNHAGRERRVILRGVWGEHMFDFSSAGYGRTLTEDLPRDLDAVSLHVLGSRYLHDRVLTDQRPGEEAAHRVEWLGALTCSAQDQSALESCEEHGGIVLRG